MLDGRTIDDDAAVRDRAYEIWEREGRPSGREHEHWAEAARDIERQFRQIQDGESAPRDPERLDGAEATDAKKIRHDGP